MAFRRAQDLDAHPTQRGAALGRNEEQAARQIHSVAQVLDDLGWIQNSSFVS